MFPVNLIKTQEVKLSLPRGTGLGRGGKARAKILALTPNLMFFIHVHFPLKLTINRIHFLPYSELKFNIYPQRHH